MRVLLAIIVLCFATAALAKFAEPFRTTSRHPLKMARHAPLPSSALAFAESDWRLNSDLEYTSNFIFKAADDGVTYSIFDHELSSLRLSGGYALSEEWALTGDFAVYHYADGFLDTFLDSYHEVFGLPNSGREDRPDNEFASTIGQLSGPSRLSGASDGLRAGNLALGVQWMIPEAAIFGGGLLGTLAARASLSLPTGDKEGLLRGVPEVSFGLLAAALFEDWSLDANLDLMLPLADDPFDSPLLKAQAWGRLLLSGAYHLSDPLSLRAQVSLGSPSLSSDPSFGHLDEWNALLSFGVQWRTHGAEWSFAFMEDLNPSADADFSIMLGAAWGF